MHDIAKKIGISWRTLDAAVATMMRKLDVSSTAELIVAARRLANDR